MTEKQEVRLYNKRVFVTNDLGESLLPKWISWIKVHEAYMSIPLKLLMLSL